MSSAHDDEFRRLMERVRTGCPDAAREVYERYSSHIRLVVRRRLHQRLRSQYDSLDFMQDVWASFFVAPQESFAFDDPDSLLRYLVQMAYNKVTDEFRRRFYGKKHNVQTEGRLDAVDENGRKAPEPPAPDPTPSQTASANERWQNMLDALPDDRYRVMMMMLRQGHSYAEIGERTGVHPKTIQRLLRKVAQRRDLQ